MSKGETVSAVITKLFVGSCFYLLSRAIMKTCSEPLGSFDYVEAADHLKNKYCPVGETAFGKGVFLMTIGWLSMSPALLYFWVFRKPRAVQGSYGWKAAMLVALPSLTDMVSTVLSTFGLPLISLSLAFIFKGARVVFSALLTVFFLRRKLYGYHWLSVCMCVLGLGIGASSQLLSEPSSFGGVVLVLGSEVFKSLRVVLEERLMKSKSFEPTFLVGVEGIYGAFIFSVALIVIWLGVSGDDHGSLENLEDTFYRISQSKTLTALFLIFPPVTCIVSIASAVVTKNLSAVHNGFISVARFGILWIFELIMYYSFSGSAIGNQLGEPWNQYSWLKLIGFIVVFVSTLIYDEDLKLRCWFHYNHLLPASQNVVKESHEELPAT
jgi:hypothetical protein